MPTKILSKVELEKWIADSLPDPRKSAVIYILFNGDRLTSIDEAVAYELDGQIVAVATIAPTGHPRGDGTPSIEAIYTLKAFRRKGYGRAVLKAAIARCAERGFTKTRYNVISEASAQLLEALTPKERALLDVHDFEWFMDDPILFSE